MLIPLLFATKSLHENNCNDTEECNKLTVDEMLEFCQKLKAEGKGDYTFNLDGYYEIDFDVQDYNKSVRLW